MSEKTGCLPILTHEYILENPEKLNGETRLPIGQYALELIKEHGNEVAMVNSMTNQEITYNEIVKQTLAVAAGLKARKLQPGDVVAISSENRFEFGPVYLGSWLMGISVAPLNPVYNTDELLHTMSISRPTIVFCSPLTADKINSLRKTMPFIKEVIIFGQSTLRYNSYSDLLKTSTRGLTFPEINPEESVAFLLCSSGTTGLPKCVELSHMNFMCLLRFIGKFWKNQVMNVRRATLGLVPFFHGYGCLVVIAGLINKTLNVVMPRFDERVFLESIQKYQISDLFLVPPLVIFLSKHPLVEKYDLSCVKKITCGAAPLSRESQTATQKRLKLDFEIQQAYGMTELTLCCVAFQTEVRKVGSSGTIAPEMKCKIVDLETGKPLPPYKQGELCFKGPFVMKGYRNNPQATAEAFDSDGWFHTGDIAYYDNEGFLFIVDRLKELIKYKGYQVPPAELETILLTHPKVKDAAVIGLPDEVAGELPLAYVAKQPGVTVTEEEIKKFVADKVSPQKRLHGGVRFVNEIPKNPSGKILRRELRAALKKSKL